MKTKCVFVEWYFCVSSGFPLQSWVFTRGQGKGAITPTTPSDSPESAAIEVEDIPALLRDVARFAEAVEKLKDVVLAEGESRDRFKLCLVHLQHKPAWEAPKYILSDRLLFGLVSSCSLPCQTLTYRNVLCLDLFWTKRSGSPSKLSTLKISLVFPTVGATHTADTKPCKVLNSRPPFSSFGETTIVFALSLPFCVTPFWQELTQRGHEGSNLTSAVFSDTCARCARGEEEEYVMGGASLHKQALQEALSFLSPNGGSALTKTTARLSPAGNQFFVYCRHVLVLHVHDAVKL